ncbi:MAG: hypothetical protein EOM14_09140 [Clostridia bacterium]|nr:hypothetical protein [Clostridia bacterium]
MESFSTRSIGTILGSAVLTALIAFFSKGREERMTCVAEERRRWRTRLREIASRTSALAERRNDADGDTMESLRALAADLETRLNPSDSFDRKIVDEMKNILIQKEIGSNDAAVRSSEKLNAMIACLLKHDWERAKIEADIPYKHVVAAFALSAIVTWFVYSREWVQALLGGPVFSSCHALCAYRPLVHQETLSSALITRVLTIILIYTLAFVLLTTLYTCAKNVFEKTRRMKAAYAMLACILFLVSSCLLLLLPMTLYSVLFAATARVLGCGFGLFLSLLFIILFSFFFFLLTSSSQRLKRVNAFACAPIIFALRKMLFDLFLAPAKSAEELYRKHLKRS